MILILEVTNALWAAPKFLGLKPFERKHQYMKIKDFRLCKILKRCGGYLTAIDVSSISDCMLSLVAEYCPNIENITCKQPSDRGIRKLTKSCKNISYLRIEGFLKSVLKLHWELFFHLIRSFKICILHSWCLHFWWKFPKTTTKTNDNNWIEWLWTTKFIECNKKQKN